ncbi:hypothetical protein [Winogradskyella pulchriflava]|uniref:Uncharacterized protein n=1 Tax=Winogradskyella pulchriflava TaxID=1110688 RepID=A0ABV6QCA1_9FLAO
MRKLSTIDAELTALEKRKQQLLQERDAALRNITVIEATTCRANETETLFI